MCLAGMSMNNETEKRIEREVLEQQSAPLLEAMRNIDPEMSVIAEKAAFFDVLREHTITIASTLEAIFEAYKGGVPINHAITESCAGVLLAHKQFMTHLPQKVK